MIFDRLKALVGAKGYNQRYDLDYNETYCSVVKIMSTRVMICHAAEEKLLIKQFDIKTASLYGSLNESLYMIPPGGYEQENVIWRLKNVRKSEKQCRRAMPTFKNRGLRRLKLCQFVFVTRPPLSYSAASKMYDQGGVKRREPVTLAQRSGSEKGARGS